MPNPMFNPQPNYSGVTIQITNPTVNAGNCPPHNSVIANGNYATCPQTCYCSQPYYAEQLNSVNNVEGTTDSQEQMLSKDANVQKVSENLPQAYPAQYYLNNYNYQGKDPNDNFSETKSGSLNGQSQIINNNEDNINPENSGKINMLKHYDDGKGIPAEEDLRISQAISDDLDSREAEIKAKKENTKETKIVALTDEYIKSLENYLNNPNNEIRLMASKEILTRLDEDKDRYNDAALNALLNKMIQDPSKLIRVAALSAFASGLASGNDYTVQLLQNIQSNPSADKEDVLQAADILLKMSAGTEVKNIPVPNETQKK